MSERPTSAAVIKLREDAKTFAHPSLAAVKCVDCKHLSLRPCNDLNGIRHCNHPAMQRSLVTGHSTIQAAMARAELGLCGPDGELFAEQSDRGAFATRSR